MIIAVSGLAREARIAAGPQIETVVGGGNADTLRERLKAALSDGATGILSIGIAAALSAQFKAGDCIVASHIVDGANIVAVDTPWSQRLLANLPDAVSTGIAGCDRILATPIDKSALREATGAQAADMESHIAARAAAVHSLPFACLRTISDAADHDLPPAACVALKSDGAIDLAAVLRSLVQAPQQLPDLIRTGIEAEKGFRALLRSRNLLGPGLLGPGPFGADLG